MTTLFWMFGILITANELPEFNHTFLDVMHQPLEDCIITISGQNLL
jgi:predicted ATPase with chaperone activity